MDISELILGISASVLANLFERVAGDAKNTVDERKLRETVFAFLEKEKGKNGLTSIEEEYDYGGLLDYFQRNLIADITEWLSSPNDWDTNKNAVISKAAGYASANTTLSKDKIAFIINTIAYIIITYHTNAVPNSLRVWDNQLAHRIEESIVARVSDKLQNHSRETNNDVEKPYVFNLEKSIETKRNIILNQSLFPWFYNSIRLRDAFADDNSMFIQPQFDSSISFSDLPLYKDSYLSFLGPAGAGKSTLFMYFFAFTIIKDTYVIYLTAKEATTKSDLLDQINAYPLLNRNKHLLLIDSIDEAFFNDYEGYRHFVEKVKLLENCRVWIGCRMDFYSAFSGESTILAQKNIILKPWEETQYSAFIDGYSRICKDDGLQEKIDRILGNETEHQEMKKNPFMLSLVVFLASENDIRPVSGIYDLYERFLKQWIHKEQQRGSSPSDISAIMKSLLAAADCIYNNNLWTFDDIALHNSAVSCLLRHEESDLFGTPIASSFYHRSIAAFLLAQRIVKCFEECCREETHRLLSTKLKDDVTNFVGEHFRWLSIGKREILKKNLSKLYYMYPEANDNLSFHEQIIYFITRIGVNVDPFLMGIINKNPQNKIMRLTLAYGCILSENTTIRQYALNYAESISKDSIDAKTNRGWTVVYFGDVNDRDPYTYLDDEKRSWQKARQARIRRFTREHPRLKDVRFWLFDIPLFHSFLKDRNWNEISESEYSILNSLCISDNFFSAKEVEFLEKEKAELIKGYAEHLKTK